MFLFIFSLFSIAYSSVLLETDFGSLQGNRSITPEGFQYSIFAGVPFAAKTRRFEKSKIVEKWSGILDATQFAAECVGQNLMGTFVSEDCLYLNIITPYNNTKTSDLLPVVVLIHGGAFIMGGPSDTPAEHLAANFVSQGIIVVSIQYRLAAYGFMSLGCGSSILPCNLGIWDQVTAIQFVDRIIGSFGGDNKRMTLMGHSAGSMSVGIHASSPISSKYFNNFIELSGSFWGQQPISIEQASRKIIEKLNCSLLTESETLECLRSASIEDFYKAQRGSPILPPVMGDDLIPGHPSKYLEGNKKKNLLVGLQTLEILYGSLLQPSPQKFTILTRENVTDYIGPIVENYYGKNEEINSKIVDFYLPRDKECDNIYSTYQRSRIQSDLLFNVPTLREVQGKLRYYNSIYLYHFEHVSKEKYDPREVVKVSTHCDEYPYLWNKFIRDPFNFTDDDRQVSRFFIDSIGNFIKHRNPSTSSFSWPLTDSDLTHVKILPTPVIATDLFRDSLNFWNFMEKFTGYDLVTYFQLV